MIQPSDCNRWIRGVFSVAGLKHNEVTPIELFTPVISNTSFTLISKPCSGPIGPPLVRQTSSSFALVSAAENKGSVIQFVIYCVYDSL